MHSVSQLSLIGWSNSFLSPPSQSSTWETLLIRDLLPLLESSVDQGSWFPCSAIFSCARAAAFKKVLALDIQTVHSSRVINMLRAVKPKLSLAIPTGTSGHGAPKSPFPKPISPSPINSPTARNTLLNQRGLSTLQPPSFSYSQSTDTKSILKKDQTNTTTTSKKIQFKETPTVTCLSPMPPGYHGEYFQMSRDEKRWFRLT